MSSRIDEGSRFAGWTTVSTRPRQLTGGTVLRPWVWKALFLGLALTTIWVSLGDHPLHGRSEGRYATVGGEMAQSGDWLVPTWMGHPHFTKPPLIYWLEAAGIRLLGSCELAVRLPSAVAGSLTLIVLFGVCHRLLGLRVALTAAALLAIMPLHSALSRLATTDALLTLFWTAALVAGGLAVERPKEWRWPVLLWLAVALGLLTKGPVVLIVLLVLMVWLLLAGRGREVLRLRPLLGLPLALAPLLAWAATVVILRPEAAEIWSNELFSRFTDHADHAEPFWFFLPVFIGGLFPATLVLWLPGFHCSWREARRVLRSGSVAALCIVAIVLPFIIFSASRGKLVSYLMPLGPPVAMLGAMSLERWFDRSNDESRPGVRPPDLMLPWLLTTVIGAIGATVAASWFLGWTYLWAAAPLWPLAIAAVWMHRIWWRAPSLRVVALAASWGLVLICFVTGYHLEDALLRFEAGGQKTLARIQNATGLTQPQIATFGFTDTTLGFYHGQPVPRLDVGQLKEFAEQAATDAPSNRIVVAKMEDWDRLRHNRPEVAAFLQPLQPWSCWPREDHFLLLIAHNTADAAAQP